MKNKIFFFGLALLSMVFAFSPLAFSQAVGVQPTCGQGTVQQGALCLPPTPGAGIGSAQDATSFIIRIINILLGLAATVAILFIVLGGFRIITAAGNEKTAGEGKKTVTNALIGLSIIILSFVIVTVVNTTISRS